MMDLSKLSDEQVVELVRSVNKENYAEIIRRYQSKLVRYATYLVNDPDTGADIAQESFIKAYVNLNSFKTDKKFSSWIYRIAHNEAINTIKKYKKSVSIDETFDLGSGEDIEDEFIKDEIISRTHRCLNNMPIIYREPLSLYYLEEKSYEDISDILRIPTSTVGTRISRAKSIMKKICQNLKK